MSFTPPVASITPPCVRMVAGEEIRLLRASRLPPSPASALTPPGRLR
eukprot:CAMPEP_0114146146 /NCGR_PEP_ID=MMETSP0043_2-20121206/20411_1 /TAXON_ID=464988 /ORGANISM="Hemiselmis andersenii, Strain CCMP644" /LENGTH=46 /DNA_ID= /DNA_START= /DNA_END= /DNA_ORIENTATION=